MNTTTVPLLPDHTFGGQAVLPTVSVMEWLIRAVDQERGLSHPFAIEQYALYKGITLPSLTSEQSLHAQIDAQEERIQCKLCSYSESGAVRYHYGLDIVLHHALPDTMHETIMTQNVGRSIEKTNIYQDALFHEGVLQGIQSVSSYNEQGLTALCHITSQDVSTSVRGNHAIANPIADDLVLQALILWPRLIQGVSALPSRFKRWHYMRPVPLDQDFYIRLEVLETSAMKLVANVIVSDAQGKAYMAIELAEASLSPALNELFLKKL